MAGNCPNRKLDFNFYHLTVYNKEITKKFVVAIQIFVLN